MEGIFCQLIKAIGFPIIAGSTIARNLNKPKNNILGGGETKTEPKTTMLDQADYGSYEEDRKEPQIIAQKNQFQLELRVHIIGPPN